MKGPINPVCINCHFLVKQSNPGTFEVTHRNREAIKNQDYSQISNNYSLGCYFGVWDEGHNFSPELRHQTIVLANRKNYCFFWPHRPGMLLPAAEILQKREADNHAAGRDRRFTLLGLWIAALALAADVISKWLGGS
jgi:hypothetical protein